MKGQMCYYSKITLCQEADGCSNCEIYNEFKRQELKKQVTDVQQSNDKNS